MSIERQQMSNLEKRDAAHHESDMQASLGRIASDIVARYPAAKVSIDQLGRDIAVLDAFVGDVAATIEYHPAHGITVGKLTDDQPFNSGRREIVPDLWTAQSWLFEILESG